MVAPTVGRSGSRPAERAHAMTTGTTLFAAAALLVISERRVAIAVASARRPNRVWTPRCRVRPLPKFDEHDVAELRLRIVGDADGGDVALDAEPFVIGGVERGHGDPSAFADSTFVGIGNERHGSDP